MPTLLTLANGKGSPTTRSMARISGLPWPWETIPNEDILINVEALRRAICKGNWKLIECALLPGKTELFDLSKDPGEQNNVTEQHPDIVRDNEGINYQYSHHFLLGHFREIASPLR